MTKAKNKNIRRAVSLLLIAAVVVLLAAMPLLARQEQEADGPTASILSAAVETGSIDTRVLGGGTLTEEDPEAVTVASAVKITGYLVENGDRVSKGDPIASVDRVTVMTAVAEVQETLDYLAEKIDEESEKDTDGEVAALAGGTVKMLYAREGDAVQDVMLEYGALAVLSLDGRMAVDLTVGSGPEVGDAVTLVFPDGTEAAGEVETFLAGEMTVTAEDDGFAPGEAVQVLSAEGSVLGSGELYIFSPWNAAAYAGTVSAVEVAEGETVDAGESILTLTDVGYTAAYRQLVSRRQAYEELMMDLFSMYQTGLVTAPCDGIVSGVDADSTQLLQAGGEYAFTLLAAAPDGTDSELYIHYVGQVMTVGDDGWSLQADLENLEITDYTALADAEFDTEAMTEKVTYDPLDPEMTAPIYEFREGAWVQIEAGEVAEGDFLVFADDRSGRFVWIIRIPGEDAPDTPADPDVPVDPDIPTDPDTPVDPDIPTDPSDPGTPGNPGMPSDPGSSYPMTDGMWGSMGGSYPQFGGAEEEFTLYGMDVVEIAAVTPQDTVTLTITVSEQDVNLLRTGMEADVHIEALGGEKFAAVISDIGNTGTNNGGYSTFAVEVTMERAGNMLGGMNATVGITVDSAENVLTVPAEALCEEGTHTRVYTGYNAETGTLTDPVEVETGVSDGLTVEIVAGLTAGDTVWYAYYDTLEISAAPDFGGMGGFGGAGGFLPGR